MSTRTRSNLVTSAIHVAFVVAAYLLGVGGLLLAVALLLLLVHVFNLGRSVSVIELRPRI